MYYLCSIYSIICLYIISIYFAVARELTTEQSEFHLMTAAKHTMYPMHVKYKYVSDE